MMNPQGPVKNPYLEHGPIVLGKPWVLFLEFRDDYAIFHETICKDKGQSQDDDEGGYHAATPIRRLRPAYLCQLWDIRKFPVFDELGMTETGG